MPIPRDIITPQYKKSGFADVFFNDHEGRFCSFMDTQQYNYQLYKNRKQSTEIHGTELWLSTKYEDFFV